MEEVQHMIFSYKDNQIAKNVWLPYGNPRWMEISNNPFRGSEDVDVDVPKLEELLTQDVLWLKMATARKGELLAT